MHKQYSTKLPLFLVTLGFFMVLFSVKAFAASYYFDSVNGNDATVTSSSSTPWKSTSKIFSTLSAAVTGDNFYFADGSSWNVTNPSLAQEGLAVYKSGLTFQSYNRNNTGQKPVFTNHQDNNSSAKVMLLQGSNNVVDGLKIQGNVVAANGNNGVHTDTANGIYIYLGQNNIIKNTEITGVGQGIVVQGKNNMIRDNNIHDLYLYRNTLGTPGTSQADDDAGALAIVLSSSNNEIYHNTITNCVQPSFDYIRDGGAIEIYVPNDTANSNTTVNGNYIHHNYMNNTEGFMELGGQPGNGGAANNTVSYNEVVNTGRLLYFHLSGNFATSASNLNIYNNDVIQTATVASDIAAFIYFSNTPTNANILNLKNNIFSLSNFPKFSQSSVFTHSYNIYKLDPSTTLGFTLSTAESLTDPLFTNVTSGNYNLLSSSSSVNTGTTLGTVTNYLGAIVNIQAVDYAGISVPQQSIPEIGALEFVSIVTPTPTATIVPTATSTSTLVATTTVSPTNTIAPTAISTPTPTKSKGKPRIANSNVLAAEASLADTGSYALYPISVGILLLISVIGILYIRRKYSKKNS
jgi:hypothetical protein